MKRIRKKILMVLFMALGLLGLTSCGSDIPPNRVNSIEDIEGKTIGVQLGTTGDIYASDYEGDNAGTKIERYNKGADAVSSLVQGKIDCVIIDEQPAKAYLRENAELMILNEVER